MEERIGQVTHFYNRIRVAVLELTGELKEGDVIHILGRTTGFTQGVESMEIEHRKVQAVGPGDEVALKVINSVHRGDVVYKVTQE
jgi:translation elongation factor EF-1alpha